MKVVECLPSTLMSSVVAGPHSSVLDDFELLLATAIVDWLRLARRFVQHWHAHGEVLGVLRLRVLLELWSREAQEAIAAKAMKVGVSATMKALAPEPLVDFGRAAIVYHVLAGAR